MDKKYSKDYWKQVKREAWKSAWVKSGMKIIIPFLFVLLLASALGGLFFMIGILDNPFVKDNLWANILTGLSQLLFSIVVLICLFISTLSQIPPKLHKENEDVIEKQRVTIIDLEERISSKKIRIDDNGDSRIQKNAIDTELLFTIYNDSLFLMDNWSALVEEVIYDKKGDQHQEDTNFPKNKFHLVWIGDPAMGNRIKPIPHHDYAQISIAETISKLNSFKITTMESTEIRFQKEGYYVISIRINGMFDGIGCTKRIQISVLYKGKKGIEKIQGHMDLPEVK